MFDPTDIEDTLGTINAVEGTWDLPPLPDTVKLDLSTITDAPGSKYFLYSLQNKINAATARYDHPTAGGLVTVESGDPLTGAMARGMQTPLDAVLPVPGAPPASFPSEPVNTLDRFGHFGAGVMGGSILPGQSRYGNQYDIGQKMPYVRDANAVQTLKRQAIEMGILPQGTRIDNSWDPSMNGVVAEMANEDFERSMSGQRPGAINVRDTMLRLGEFVSPEFAFMISREIVRDVAKGFWWDPGDIKDQWNENWANVRQLSRGAAAGDDVSTWDLMAGYGKAIFGTVDDVVMPVINWALVFSGVAEVAVGARVIFGLGAGRAALRGAESIRGAATAARAFDTANDLTKSGRVIKSVFRGLDEAAHLNEYERWVRTGKIVNRMQDSATFGGWNPVGKLEAWRSMKGVLMGKKATQQMMRFGQAQILMSMAGENPADHYIESARGRYEEWGRNNIAASAAIGILSGVALPRNIWRPSSLVQRSNDKLRNLRVLTSHEYLGQEAVTAKIAHLMAVGDTSTAQSLEAIMKTKGAQAAWNAALFGTEGLTDAQRSHGAMMLWEAVAHAGLDYRVRQAARSMKDWDSLTRAQQRVRYFTIKNHLVEQIKEWDPEDITAFESKLDGLLSNADSLGKDDFQVSVLSEMKQWADADDITRKAEFASWATRANDMRGQHLSLMMQPIIEDPMLLQSYLRNNPTWMDPEQYSMFHLGDGELRHWITNNGDGLIDYPMPMARGATKAGVGGGPAVKRRLDSIKLDERKTLSTLNESDRFPSLSELLAPGGDPAVRAAAGLDNPMLDKALTALFEGKLTMRQSLLGSQSNANILYRTLDDPEVGQFTLAKLDTMTGNEAMVFIDHVDSVVRHQRLLRSLNRGAVNNMRRLGQVLAARGTDVTQMTETQFRAFVSRALGKAKITRRLSAQMGTDAGVKELQSLYEFLTKGGVDLTDLKTVENVLDDRLRGIMNTDVWYDTLGADDAVRLGAQEDTVAFAVKVLDQSRGYARTLAHDVHDAPSELVEHLASLGYKPVFGKEFLEPAAMKEALGLVDKLPALSSHGDMGQVAFSMFMPDSMARSKMFQNLADRAGRMSSYLLRPGERQFMSHFEKVLKQRIALRLNQAKSDRYSDLSWDDDAVDVIYRDMWGAINKGRYSAQSAFDNTTGFKTPQRIQAALTPQTIRDSNPARLVSRMRDKQNNLYGEMWDEADVTALERAIRDSLFTGWDDELDTALQLRGPLLMAEDWIRTHGLARGAAVGLPLMFGSMLRKPMRELAQQSARRRALTTAAGVIAFDAAGEAMDGDAATSEDVNRILGTGLAAGAGVGLGGRPLRTGLGAVAGEMIGGEDLGLAGSVLGAGVGAATSSQVARNMENRMWNRVVPTEASVLGRAIGGAAGGMFGEAGAAEAGVEDPTGLGVARGIGAAVGAAFGPSAAAMGGRAITRTLAPPIKALTGHNSLRDFALEFGRFNNSTLTNRAFNLSMALRFTLSPLFDAQRHLELASFAFTKQVPDGVHIPLRPMGRNAFVKIHGEEQWQEWASRFDSAGTRVQSGIEMGHDAGEVSARMFMQEGILGFNPTAKGVSIFRSLVEQGMGEDESFRLARSLLSYGVEGRTTGELTLNAVFFPFSFQARYVGRWAKFIQDDVMRANLITEGVRTYQLLDENYDLDAMFEEHLPLMDQLNKLNAFGFGISPGEFGGIHRPWINFFVPVVATAIKTGQNTVNFRNPYTGIAAVGEGYSRAREEVLVEGGDLVNRMIPMWRDVNFLVEDLKEQGHVIFSPHHKTTEAEANLAYGRWKRTQDAATQFAMGQGYQSLASYTASAQGRWLGEQLRKEKAVLGQEYPVWQEAIERSVQLNAASRFTLAQRALNPTRPVDFDIRNFEQWMDQLQATLPVGYDIGDPSSLPPDIQQAVREYALQLANRNRGFDAVWDKYYRKVWGPITRPLYLSLPVEGSKSTAQTAP